MAKPSSIARIDSVPSDFEPELYYEIAARVAGGERISTICAEPGMPDRRRVWEFTQRDAEFAKAMAGARTISAHFLEEDALAIAEKLAAGKVHKDQVRAMDVALTQFRWSAGRRNPAYNDKTAQVPTTLIQINTDLWSEAGELQPVEFKVSVGGTAAPLIEGEFTDA